MLSFVTVNWHSANATSRLVHSIARVVEVPHEMIVVNNDCAESPALGALGEEHPQLAVVESVRNIGFAAACNRGASLATGRYLVFVNPDVVIHRLPASVFQELHARFGDEVLFGTVLRKRGLPARGSVRRFPTSSRVLVDSSGLDRIVPWLRGCGLLYRNEEDLPPFAVVEQPVGAFFGVGRRLFLDLGGFDERFFVFFEEVDLALRAAARGIPIVTVPEILAEHEGGHTTREDRTVAVGLRWRSLRAFHAKYAACRPLPPAWALILLEATRFTIQRALPGIGHRFSLVRALRIALLSSYDQP